MARRQRRSFGAVRKLPSGRFQASYLDPHGKRINAPTTFTTKGDADAWLSIQRAALETGTWKRPGARMTVGEYGEQWLAGRRVRESTAYGNRLTFDRWIVPTFGSTPLRDLTTPMVRKWLGIFPSSKPAARVHAYRLFSTMMTSAVDDGLIGENPVRVRGAAVYTVQREGRVLTHDEVQQVAEHMPKHHRIAVPLAAYGALRIGEVMGLRRRDVDMQAGTISVRETVNNGARLPRTGAPKTEASRRTIYLPAALMADVREHLDEHAADGPAGHLFPSPVDRSRPITPGAWRLAFNSAVKAAKLEDVHPHDLRHTGLTWAAQTGATTAELMARAGHSTPTVAMRYQHAGRDRDKSIADALGDNFPSSGGSRREDDHGKR